MNAPIKILIVDDDENIRQQVGAFLEGRGYQVTAAEGGEQALSVLASEPCRIALIDFKMPGMDGLQLVAKLRRQHPDMVLFMMTAFGTVETAVAALKAGVHDYLLKPIGPEQLEHKLKFVSDKLRAEDELLQLRSMVQERYRFGGLIGVSPSMQRVFSLIESAARSDLPVLIYGETGTGKELAAKTIHLHSSRRPMPFVALNCAAVPESLIESELFGHVKGAFTGADRNRAGALASADGGTLLLDELSAAPESFQVRLLRVLEEKTFTPVGSDAPREADVRIIAAMNTPPEEALACGSLRRDLFYRINVMRIDIPPLRERLEDIPLLVREVLTRAEKRPAEPEPQISASFLDELRTWSWPGNVRELHNIVEAALACSSGLLSADDIPHSLKTGPVPSPAMISGPARLGEVISDAERGHIQRVLRHTGGNMKKAARILDIDERSLRRKLKKLGIDRRAFRPA